LNALSRIWPPWFKQKPLPSHYPGSEIAWRKVIHTPSEGETLHCLLQSLCLTEASGLLDRGIMLYVGMLDLRNVLDFQAIRGCMYTDMSAVFDLIPGFAITTIRPSTNTLSQHPDSAPTSTHCSSLGPTCSSWSTEMTMDPIPLQTW
jgi:hypothetical protein